MLFRLTLLLFLLNPLQLLSQSLCTGNLGDNIFNNGDFGFGTANIVATDPNIAPGYHYRTTGPLVDGEYRLTNNTGGWGDDLYDSWLNISDNSTNPNGYMMVVNASFSAGLFYEQTVRNLCENTVYEFSADIINMIRRNVGGHSAPNLTFLLNDQEIMSTGDIPQDERWHNFGFTFTTTTNQNSVKLSLRNNAPGGIGNDLALDNISFRACGPETLIGPTGGIDNVCGLEHLVTISSSINGTSFSTPAFQWQKSTDNGSTWQNITGETNSTLILSTHPQGLTYYRYLLANSTANLASTNCRINSEAKGYFVVPTATAIQDTVCEGISYQFNDQTLHQTGTYFDTLTNILGCDSIITLHLTQIPNPTIAPDVSVNQRLCTEDPEASIVIHEIVNGSAPYSISLNGSTPSANTQFNNLTTGNYDLVITDQFGCTFQEQYQIAETIPFELELGNDFAIVLGEQIQLNPTANFPIIAHEWTPAFLCNTICSSPIWFPIDSTTVSLTATSSLGCKATDELNIQVEKARLIQFPTAFSPNNDGLNDVFIAKAQTPNVTRIENLTIYDRWGGVVFSRHNFQADDLTQGWKGTKGDEFLPPGIYPYRAEVLFLDNLILTYVGSVTLIR